ncbi:MAG: hypothetical protein JWR03_3226, partial [Cohnella sp.]|nr:hypothetical protein [Cohnella sp.]
WAVVHFDPANSPSNVAALMETRTIENVKVEPFGLDERNFTLLGIEPQTVKLTVRGTKSDLLAARKEDYRLQMDLRNVGEGKRLIPLVVDRLPRGIQLYGISPSSVNVTVEGLQTKEFEVNIQTEGNPADGYIAGTPIVKPTNRVHVTLPKSTLAQVQSVGAVIPVNGTTNTIKSKAVKLAAFDTKGRVIQGAAIDPAVLEVEVPITNPFKIVPLQFRMLGKMPTGLSIASFKPDVGQVTIYGSKEALNKVDFVEADVQLGDLTKTGKMTVPLISVEPITEIAPANTVVDVEVVLSQTRSLEGLPVTWTGMGDGLTVKITNPSTEKVDIVLKGAPAVLNQLQPGDVQVLADLSGKGPGTHTFPLVVNLPRFIEQAGGTTAVTVEITAAAPASASPSVPAVNGAAGSTATPTP